MKDKSNRVPCNQKCDANCEGFCMWRVDDRLITLAQDKEYKMCEYLREKVLNK